MCVHFAQKMCISNVCVHASMCADTSTAYTEHSYGCANVCTHAQGHCTCVCMHVLQLYTMCVCIQFPGTQHMCIVSLEFVKFTIFLYHCVDMHTRYTVHCMFVSMCARVRYTTCIFVYTVLVCAYTHVCLHVKESS